MVRLGFLSDTGERRWTMARPLGGGPVVVDDHVSQRVIEDLQGLARIDQAA